MNVNRDDRENVDDKYEKNEIEYINFNDYFTPNLKKSITPRETLLK